MDKQYIRQTSFATGELSPKLKARSELQQYNQGAKKMRNVYTLAHGGAKRRPGTVFIGEVNDSSEFARIIPFVFSKTVAYHIVMNAGKFQFIRNGAFITTGSPETRVELTCPYNESELSEVTFQQIGPSLYLCHFNYPPKVITRSSDTSWQIEDVAFTFNAISDAQWYDTAYVRFKIVSGTTPFVVGDAFQIDSETGIVTPKNNTGSPLTFGGSPNANEGTGTIFGESDGVAIIKAGYGSPKENWTVVCIYADADRTEWTVVGETTGVPIGTWKANDYPAAIGLYEQRLWLGGTPSDPQKIWFSEAGGYQNLTPGFLDTDGNYLTIASGEFDQILHLIGGRRMIPLTFGSEFSIVGGDTKGITPSTIKIQEQTKHGTSTARPVRVGPDVLFVQRGGKKVRAISYLLAEEVNQAPDITILAEHVTGDGVTELSFAQDPDYLVWAVRQDGAILTLTLIRDFGTEAWAIHTTDGFFESVSTIPNVTVDQTAVVVQRFINGNWVRYVEYFDYVDGAQTDCALFATLGAGSPTLTATQWGGFDHLIGETVTVVADGSDVGDHVVVGSPASSAGTITLSTAANTVEVGLNYTSRVTLLHPNVPLQDGTSQGRITKVDKVVLDLYETNGAIFVGLEDEDGVMTDIDEINFLVDGDIMDVALDLFTGKKSKTLGGWSDEFNVAIEQRSAYKFTLLGTTLSVVVNKTA